MSKSLKLIGGTAVGVGGLLVLAVNFADRNITQLPPAPERPKQVASVAPSQPPAAPAEAPAEGVLVAAATAAEEGGSTFGIGRPALPEEIAAWDLDVSPDGTGLPEGSGDVWEGEAAFEESCAACHGSFAEGVGNWPKLAGGQGTLDDKDPVKTVGSYWPYLSTVWDYVHRSMPFGNAQSLSNDEVYAITAYILYSNGLVEDDFVLDRETFDEVVMPNADGFIVDDRPETEYTKWRTEPCMEDCKETVEITMRASVLDVTPGEEGGDDGGEQASTSETESAPEEVTVTADESATEDSTAEAGGATEVAAIDQDLADAGERVFRKCKACHQVGEGAKNRTGPQLNGVVGREIGGLDGFKYSNSMSDMEGAWDAEALHGFLADPRGYVKGTRMAFAGLRDEGDIDAVVEYLRTFE
ncbi:c-type cytochrome [Salipiger mucosus]|uniref:Sulfite dehydrogenase cytochrome subunit SoxD n=1 Tax=Salipiger mucosus DSM 16094 TaxID=1123237 RepID=S9QW81_9RHOB|nr:c-type cytochrome [Salipiger mucosus]EPX85601.1 Sulfite dehydrogenase cytochrome subunit SoxD [Salipiger mucosus DSM 16094]